MNIASVTCGEISSIHVTGLIEGIRGDKKYLEKLWLKFFQNGNYEHMDLCRLMSSIHIEMTTFHLYSIVSHIYYYRTWNI